MVCYAKFLKCLSYAQANNLEMLVLKVHYGGLRVMCSQKWNIVRVAKNESKYRIIPYLTIKLSAPFLTCNEHNIIPFSILDVNN